MRYNESYKNDYFDLTISNDSRDFERDYSDCDLINIDVTKSLCSIKNRYEGSDVTIDNITLTGYDNYFLNHSDKQDPDAIIQKTSNDVEVFSNPTINYVVEKGDTFCLHPVSGYTGLYTYNIELNKLDRGQYYNHLKGGFYQGFFKINNQPVEWFPHRAKLGWTANKVIHLPLHNDPNGKLLNNNYPGNEGFIFYLGTRAENKFSDLTDIEISKLDEHYSIKPKEGKAIYSYKEPITLNGIDRYIGYYTFHNGSMYSGRSYTVDSKPLKYHEEYKDLDYNAIGVRITEDGRIGYRAIYPTDKCYTGSTQDVTGITTNSFITEPDDQCKNHSVSKIVTKHMTIEECYTKKPIINLNENKFLHISTVFERDFPYNTDCELKYGDYKKGTLSIYINGFLVLRNHDFIEIITHALDEQDELQKTVPYNISFGGGTQNLIEATYLDNTKKIDTVLERFFAGTFMGGVKDLQMLCVPLYTMEIKEIVKSIKPKYGLRTINGGRKVFINKLF